MILDTMIVDTPHNNEVGGEGVLELLCLCLCPCICGFPEDIFWFAQPNFSNQTL